MAGYPTDSVTKEDKYSFRIPKNIRQMGNIQGSVKIYMEDYVYTYLHSTRQEDDWKQKGCILLGNKQHENGQKYLFISGLIRISDKYFKEGQPDFTDEMWGETYREIKQFYEDVEILGWGMDVAAATTKITGELERIHRQLFSGGDKIIYLQNSVENEETFYVNEKNNLRRRDGYYIYYEKNPQMHEYMLRSVQTEEAPIEKDPQQELVANYRAITQEKSRHARSGLQRLAYAICLVLLVGISAIGVNMITGSSKSMKLKNAVSFLETNAPHIESEVTPVANIVDLNIEEVEKENHSADVASTEIKKETASDDESSEEPDDDKEKTDIEKEEPEDVGKREQEEDDSKTTEPQEEKKTESEEVKPAAVTAKENGFYIVKKGDSLLSISQQIYGADYTEELCKLNELDDVNKIYAGQKLLLLEE
ncbi:MAG: LysM peptidoglycan-binding domain-containing protein [bacterium]|nr:LysM peptidoglycan-binding domain-containing protein [bacterium]